MSTANLLDGVGQLQLAKAAATAKVEEARLRRSNKIKQAKNEATIESNRYKAERDAALKELEERYTKEDSESGAKIERFTEQAIQKIRQRYEENKDMAIADIINQVLNVKPTIHRNAMNPL